VDAKIFDAPNKYPVTEYRSFGLAFPLSHDELPIISNIGISLKY